MLVHRCLERLEDKKRFSPLAVSLEIQHQQHPSASGRCGIVHYCGLRTHAIVFTK